MGSIWLCFLGVIALWTTSGTFGKRPYFDSTHSVHFETIESTKAYDSYVPSKARLRTTLQQSLGPVYFHYKYDELTDYQSRRKLSAAEYFLEFNANTNANVEGILKLLVSKGHSSPKDLHAAIFDAAGATTSSCSNKNFEGFGNLSTKVFTTSDEVYCGYWQVGVIEDSEQQRPDPSRSTSTSTSRRGAAPAPLLIEGTRESPAHFVHVKHDPLMTLFQHVVQQLFPLWSYHQLAQHGYVPPSKGVSMGNTPRSVHTYLHHPFTAPITKAILHGLGSASSSSSSSLFYRTVCGAPQGMGPFIRLYRKSQPSQYENSNSDNNNDDDRSRNRHRYRYRHRYRRQLVASDAPGGGDGFSVGARVASDIIHGKAHRDVRWAYPSTPTPTPTSASAPTSTSTNNKSRTATTTTTSSSGQQFCARFSVVPRDYYDWFFHPIHAWTLAAYVTTQLKPANTNANANTKTANAATEKPSSASRASFASGADFCCEADAVLGGDHGDSVTILNRQPGQSRHIPSADVTAIAGNLSAQVGVPVHMASIGSYSLQDQALMVRRSTVVVAPHGGHLSSLAFAHPCTVLVELLPLHYYAFWWYSSLMRDVGGYYLPYYEHGTGAAADFAEKCSEFAPKNGNGPNIYNNYNFTSLLGSSEGSKKGNTNSKDEDDQYQYQYQYFIDCMESRGCRICSRGRAFSSVDVGALVGLVKHGLDMAKTCRINAGWKNGLPPPP